jgi:asparagine synthase (glutamine-hydrolysing)
VTVILAGDGADEVFGGYTLYQGLRFARLYQQLPLWLRRHGIEPALQAWALREPPGPRRWRALAWRKRIADSNLPLRAMLASKFSITVPPLLGWLAPAAQDLAEPDRQTGLAWIETGGAAGSFEQTQYANTRFHQVNDMLVKVDRMSMAHSLEVRHPYLDHKVVEFAATLPAGLKLRGWQTKAILRDVAARYLPPQTASKRKHGFGVPISLWFREGLWPEVNERLRDSHALRSYLNPQAVATVLREHRDGAADYSQLIWCLLVFDAWHSAYIVASP